MTGPADELGRVRARLAELLQPGDRIVWSQGCAEPTPVLREVLAAAADTGSELLVGLTHTDTIDATVEQRFSVRRLGGLGSASRLSSPRVLPVHLSALPGLLERREIPVDVAVVQLSPANALGRHSLGIDASFSAAALAAARVRIAEVNTRMPWTNGHEPLPSAFFDLVVHTDRALHHVSAADLSDAELAAGRHAAAFVDDRAVLQAGIGRAPLAVLRQLTDRSGLGVHTGLLDHGLWALIRGGAVTNEHKEFDAGWTIAGTLAGSTDLYEEATSARVLLRDARSTHGLRTVSGLSRFTSINSALEVDLTGQVNAEWTGTRFNGGVGGLGDFVRAAQLSDRGRSLIVLPATTSDGRSRIVPAVRDGMVTVPRSDVDVVVTEWGAAQLRGGDLPQRAARLAAIAAPQHRDALARAHAFPGHPVADA